MERSKVTFAAGVVAGAVLGVVAGPVSGGWTERLEAAVTQTAASTRPAQAPAAKAAGVKYASQVVFENERVRVKDVTFPPGVPDTGMHTHDLAHVGVILTEGRLVFTEKDGKKETATFSSGSVGFRGPDATHMVANPGTTPMRVIEVELK